MQKGQSIVVGMTIAYAVSFFGLLLAYIVYQRNHNQDELWRRRPVGISFFAALYGYIIPAAILANAVLTLAIKAIKGWEFNRFIWTTEAFTYAVLIGVVLELMGRYTWRLKVVGYVSCLLLSSAATVWMLYLSAGTLTAGETSLHEAGSFITLFIWHLFWTGYFLSGKVRRLFFATQATA
ncbi:MAG TPA: hypothetical protein VJ417_15285 [Candidatus Glassbacteria bacterium]|nr:hypothetical protein [Candidatus Glassbacteria bacterium]